MKDARCKKCLNKFFEKGIYTIQQFQYRKNPTYKWSLEFFEKLGIDEWDPLCENCIISYYKKSEEEWRIQKTNSLL